VADPLDPLAEPELVDPLAEPELADPLAPDASHEEQPYTEVLSPGSAGIRLGKPGEVTVVEPDVVRLTEDEAERAGRIKSIFNQSWITDADSDAGIQRFAKQANLTTGVVKENYPELKRSWNAAHFDEVKWMREYPELAKLVLDRPDLAAVIERDEQIGYLHRALRWVRDHDAVGFMQNHPELASASREEIREVYKREVALRNLPKKQRLVQDEESEALKEGWSLLGANTKTWGLGVAVPNRVIVPFKRFGEMWDQMELSKARYELMRRRDVGEDTLDLENQVHDMQLGAVRRDYNEGPIEQIFTDVMEAAASSVSGLKEGAKVGGAAGVGAGTAAAVGTLAVTKSPVLAGKAFAETALAWGAMFGKAGAVYGTWQLESGSAYGEMLEKGVDERTAATAAKVYGLLASSIEFATWSPFEIALKGQAKEMSVKAFTEALLKNEGFLASLKKYGVAAAGEGGEEFLQDATQQAVEFFAQAHQFGWERASTSAPVDLMRSLDAGEKGVIGGAGLGVAHAGINMTGRALFADRARESANVIDLLANFESGTKDADPDAVAEYVSRLTPGLKSTFVDPNGLMAEAKRLNQDPVAMLDAMLGPDANGAAQGKEALEQALASGGKLEVPLAKFLDVQKDIRRALAPHTTTDERLPTAQQIDDKAIKEAADKLVASFEKGEQSEPQTPGEAKFLEATEAHLAAVTGDADEARQKMQLLRATIRVWSERFGQSADELFKDASILVEAGTDPTAAEVLSRRAADETFRLEGRADEIYRDEPTGLPNERAFRETKAPAGKVVGRVAVEGMKWLNDNANHAKADLLARAIALGLHQKGIKAHRIGGADFAFYVKDEAELQGIMADIKEALPDVAKGFALTGAVGADLEVAQKFLDSIHDKAISEGTRANPRPIERDEKGRPVLLDEDYQRVEYDEDDIPARAGEEQVTAPARPLGLPKEGTDKEFAAALEFPIAKAMPELEEELKQRATSLSPQDYFNTAYRDQKTGTWTALGWKALPRKKNVASLDLSGLRRVNERHGKGFGNRMLLMMKVVAQEVGGVAVDFSHLHGDEFAAQSDDPKALQGFVEALRAALDEIAVPYEERETGELTYIPLEFHNGYSNDTKLETADADLNERKRRIKAARKAGLANRRDQRAGPAGDGRRGDRGGTAASSPADRASEADAAAREVAKAIEAGDESPAFAIRALTTDQHKAAGYPQARAYVARAGPNKAMAGDWFRWCVELKGKGERPKVSWHVESTLARKGVVDPINGFSGDEFGRDMGKRKLTAKKGGAGAPGSREAREGVGLGGAARDAFDKKKSEPMSRNLFKQSEGPDHSTVFYQFPTPEESLERLREQAVLTDELIERGAKPVETADLLIEQFERATRETKIPDEFLAYVVRGFWAGRMENVFEGKEELHRAIRAIKSLAHAGVLVGAYVEDTRQRALTIEERDVIEETNRESLERMSSAGYAPVTRGDDLPFDEVSPPYAARDGKRGLLDPEGNWHPLDEIPESKNLPGQENAEKYARPGSVIAGGVIVPPGYTGKVTLEQSGVKLYQDDSQLAPGPVWYSAVERAVAAAKQEKNTPAAWLAVIEKTPGVKKEEVEFLGLREWLNEQKGSITRAQVKEFIDAHKVEVTDRTFSTGMSDEVRQAIIDNVPSWEALGSHLQMQDGMINDETQKLLDAEAALADREKRLEAVLAAIEAPVEQNEHNENLRERERLQDEVADIKAAISRHESTLEEDRGRRKEMEAAFRDAMDSGNAAFAAFKSGDFESARNHADDAFAAERDWLFGEDREWGKWRERLGDAIETAERGDTQYQEYTLGGHEEDSYKEILFRTPGVTSENYISSHFGRQGRGLLAHARISEHKTADGKPLLFIEEIQSDLHQAAREKGYERRKEERAAKLQDAVVAARVEFTDALVEAGVGSAPLRQALVFDYRSGAMEKKTLAQIDDGVQRGRELLDRLHVLGEKLRAATVALDAWMNDPARQVRTPGTTGRVPDAPFKTTWDEMVAKRLLRYAAEKGYERIGWTTGEQQAERYQLSKVVDALAYDPVSGNLRATRGGANVFHQSGVKAEELPGIVGAEVAKKLLQPRAFSVVETTAEMVAEGLGQWMVVDQRGEEAGGFYDDRAEAEEGVRTLTELPTRETVLEGDGLAIGGEGMRFAYDKRIPSIFEKLVKKFGGKVERTSLATKETRNTFDVVSAMGGYSVRMTRPDGSVEGVTNYPTREEAQAHADRENASGVGRVPAREVWSVTIPEALRQKAVAEGFPLFQEKNLLVQHNLTAENLLHADEMGGLAAPSLAISRREHPLADYGEVTLLGAPSLADPATTPVFDADVYSPRYPSTGYRVDAKAVRALEKELSPHAKAVGGYVANLDNEIEEDGVDVVTKRSLKPTLELAWLTEQGKPPMLPLAVPEAGYPGIVDAPGVLAFIEAKLEKDQSIHIRDEEQAAFEALIKEAMEALPPDDDTHVMREVSSDWLDESGHLGVGTIDRIAREARRFVTEKKGVVDKYKSEDVLKEAVDAVGREGFEQWAEAKIKRTIAGQFITRRNPNTGNVRRIPYTLENVLTEVTRKIRQGEDFNYGLGTARAAGAKKFRNLEQVKKARDKIKTEEEFRKRKDEMDARFGGLADKLRKYHSDPGGFHVLDGLAEAIGESYKRGHYLHRELEASQFKNVPDSLRAEVGDFATDLLAMPTKYFEAKPQRVVGLGEFAGAVVPEGTKPQVLEALRRHGVPVFTYAKDDEKARAQAIARASGKLDILFQPTDKALKSGPRGYTEFPGQDAVKKGLERLFKVVLQPSADHSTFLHESAHIFLDLMTELAARPDAPQKMKEDYATVLGWLDAKGPEDLVVKSKDENDPARLRHEKWARGFERYLLEGKSPAARLVRMFERFRLWLSRVYRDPRMLNVELNEDIRAVFDRMVATDKEIEAYQKVMGLKTPMLARDVFESDEDFERYLESRLAVTTAATRRLDLAASKDKLREAEKWWKEEFQAEEEAAAEAYEKLPERVAQQTLAGKGELVGRGGAEIRLARERVVEMVGEKAAKKFRTTTKENEKVDPNEVADFVGFGEDGKKMLEAILALPAKDKWVKTRAEEAMNEKHPDVVKDLAKLRKTVAEALHGDATEAHLLFELAQLKVKTSKPGSRIWDMQERPVDVIRLAAKKMVEARAIGSLDPGRALNAERASAERYARAMAKKNWQAAFAYKQEQLLNFYRWKELNKAKDEREAFLDIAAQMSKDVDGGRSGRRSELGKAHPTYREAAASMLEAIGLRPESEGPGATIEQLVAQIEADGQVVAIDPIELEKIAVKPRGWKDLTVAEMRVVRDALSNIKAAAKGLTTVIRGEKRVDFDEQVARLQDEGGRNLPPIPPSPEKGAEFLPELIGGAWQWTDGWMLTPETMLGNWLGNNDITSEAFQSFVLPVQQAKHREVDLLRGPVRRIVEAFDKMPAAIAARQSEAVKGRELFPGHTDLVPPPQRRWQILMMLLNMGNAGNIQRLTEGRGITEQQVWDAALKVGITKEEYDWVQSVWDACEDLKKPAFDLEERMNGIRPDEVVAKPFQTPFGPYRGGYFPAVYDKRGSSGVGEKQLLSQVMDPHYMPAGTHRSHLRKRAEEFADVIALTPHTIYRHLAAVAHDIAFREPVQSIARLLDDDRIAKMLRQRLGDKRFDRLGEWIKDVGRGRGGEGTAQVSPFVSAMGVLRGGMAVAVLGSSLQNVAEDLVTGLTTAAPGSELKPQYVAAGLAAVRGLNSVTAPLGLVPGSQRVLRAVGKENTGADAVEAAEQRSGELQARRGQLSRELLATISKLIARTPAGRGPLRYIKDHAFVLQEEVDRVVSSALWIGAHRQAVADGMEAGDANGKAANGETAAAVIFADKVIRGLLPSHHVVDSSAMMRNETVAAMLVFFRFWNTAYNIGRRHGPGFFSNVSTPKRAAKAIGYTFALAILGSLARGQGPDKDEDWDKWFIRKLIAGQLGKYPWMGEMFELGWSVAVGHGRKREPRNSSIVGMLAGLYDLMARAADGDKEADERVEALVRAMGMLGGQPVSQPLKTGMYGYRLATGRREARGGFDVAGGLFYGQGEHQPANPFTIIQDLVEGAPPGTGPN
jgi:GGDEF domain-containing protein